MRWTVILTTAVLAFSTLVFAQAGQQPARPFNPRDLSGIWVPTGSGLMGPGRPEMTEWGKAKWALTRPAGRRTPMAYGYFANQAEWNDPILWCDPGGYPRALWYTGGGRGNMRLVHTPNQMIQLFERDHVWRDFWMDGRSLLTSPEPRWFGYSIARWEGDTLVVESNGFDDRAWIDLNGSIFSTEMRMVERYRRLSADRLELEITITDPKTYVAPWTSEKKIFNYLPTSDRVQPGLWGNKPDGTEYGGEVREDLCLYSEQESFFTRIDPARLGGRLLLQREQPAPER
jgi:hypothetical protein